MFSLSVIPKVQIALFAIGIVLFLFFVIGRIIEKQPVSPTLTIASLICVVYGF